MCIYVAIKPFKVASGFVYHIQHDAERGTFATAIWAEDAVNIAFFNGKGKIIHGSYRAKFFGEVIYCENVFHGIVFGPDSYREVVCMTNGECICYNFNCNLEF